MEAAGGNILTFKVSQVAVTPSTVTLTPEWKVESESAITELTTLRKRVTALESLKGSEEINFEIYAEILGAQKAGYLEKVKHAQSLFDAMNARLGEIMRQISSLTKYLVNAKLDHKSGLLDESAFKTARGSIEPSLKPLMAERNELTTKLKTLEQVLPQRVSMD